jgi:hypothetical protein
MLQSLMVQRQQRPAGLLHTDHPVSHLTVLQEVEKQYKEGTVKYMLVAVLKAVQPEALTVQGEQLDCWQSICVPLADAGCVPASTMSLLISTFSLLRLPSCCVIHTSPCMPPLQSPSSQWLACHLTAQALWRRPRNWLLGA